MTNNNIRVDFVPVKGAGPSSPSKQHMLSGGGECGGVPTDIRSSSSSITTEQCSSSDDSSTQCSSYVNDLDSATKGMASMGGTTILPAGADENYDAASASLVTSSSFSSSGNMPKVRAMSYSELKWTEAPLEAPGDLAASLHEAVDAEAGAAPNKRLPLEASTTALLVVVRKCSRVSFNTFGRHSRCTWFYHITP